MQQVTRLHEEHSPGAGQVVVDLQVLCEEADQGEAGSAVVAVNGRGQGTVKHGAKGTERVKYTIMEKVGMLDVLR